MMNKLFQILGMIILIFLVACNKEDDKKEDLTSQQATFTFKTNETYIGENQRKWVIIYDNDNNILSYVELANQVEVDLPVEYIPGVSSFGIQLISSIHVSDDEKYNIDFYTHVDPGVWHLNGGTTTESPVAPWTNTIELSDFDIKDYRFQITNLARESPLFHSDHISLPQVYDPDRIWICFYDEGVAPHYKLITNVAANQSFTFSQDDFSIMENEITYNLPLADYSDVYISAEESFENGINPRFRIYNHQQYNSANSIKAFYPGNLFSRYFLSIYLWAENTFEQMIYFGPQLPATYAQLDVTEDVIQEGIHDFSSSLSGYSDVVVHNWGYWDYVSPVDSRLFNYNVYAPFSSGESFTPPELPSFIVDLNSSVLDLDLLELITTGFYEIDNVGDYKSYIERTFGENDPEEENYLSLHKRFTYNSIL